MLLVKKTSAGQRKNHVSVNAQIALLAIDQLLLSSDAISNCEGHIEWLSIAHKFELG